MTRGRDGHRRLFKRAYFEALSVAGADVLALRAHAARDRLLILNIHSVSPDANPYGPALHPDRFAWLLAWLQPRATLALFSDLPGRSERDPRRPVVVLSFDDGLKDFVDHAMPVLASAGVSANQNVIGESLETGQPPWAIRLIDLLGAAPAERVRRLHIPGFARLLRSDDAAAKEAFGAALANHFKALPPAARARAWAALHEAMHDVVVERPTRMMTTDDVAAAVSAGHEIGSHSHSHESMEHLDDTQFLMDFDRSRQALASAGCPDCTVYAFPNGSHRAGQAELLQREGVRHVLLVGERAARPESPVHTRLTVRGASPAELRMRAAHGFGVPR